MFGSILMRVAEQLKAERGEAVRKRVVWLEAEREAMRSQVLLFFFITLEPRVE